MRRKGESEATRALRREIRSRHPRFVEAVLGDARATAAMRGERSEFHSGLDALIQVLRLAWESDALFAQVMYRAKARLQALRIPVLPRLAHRMAVAAAQVSIGDPVVIEPGLYLAHGQVVIDGVVTIRRDVTIFPFVTIGLRAPDIVGPTIGRGARIGSGARVIGRVEIGAGARIGANAVVLADVPAKATAVGVPARVV